MTPYYEHAGITIYHGDCREIMPSLPKCDLVLTDPPYGIGRDKGGMGRRSFGYIGREKGARRIPVRSYTDNWDFDRPEPETFKTILATTTAAIIWGGNFFFDILPRATHWIVWDKLQTCPSFSDCEIAWTSFERKSTKKFTVEWNGIFGRERMRDHPTQKPLALMAACLSQYGQAASLILDPFMGSGTTLVAAKDQGKRAIGIELEEKYCEVAAERVRQEVFMFGGSSYEHTYRLGSQVYRGNGAVHASSGRSAESVLPFGVVEGINER